MDSAGFLWKRALIDPFSQKLSILTADDDLRMTFNIVVKG